MEKTYSIPSIGAVLHKTYAAPRWFMGLIAVAEEPVDTKGIHVAFTPGQIGQ